MLLHLLLLKCSLLAKGAGQELVKVRRVERAAAELQIRRVFEHLLRLGLNKRRIPLSQG